MKAVWNEKTVAESDDTVIIEGNHYFPPESLNKECFKPSDTETFCPWKGKASYYDLEVNGEVNKDAAWVYKSPKPAASKIENYVAFWNGVEVVE